MAEKRLIQALRGKKTDRIPFWFMRQAGRYLPEYRELRSRSGGFLDMVYNPKAAAEVTLQPIRRFGMDGAILFSDILVIPQALGQRLEFVAGEGPKLEAVSEEKDFAAFDPARIDETLGPVYETVGRVREGLKAEGFDQTAHIGFAGSPWTVACYMVEGQGSRDFMAAKTMAYHRPDVFQKLMDLICEATVHYLKQQVRAGAEALQLFDSWSGALDADQFERWSIAPTRRIVDQVKAAFPDIPVIGFPKGAGVNIGAYAEKSGVDAVALDSQIPPVWAAAHVQSARPVQGNLDPYCLFAGGDQMVQSAENILMHLGKRPFVFNLGHGIHKDTPVHHVEKLADIIRSYKV